LGLRPDEDVRDEDKMWNAERDIMQSTRTRCVYFLTMLAVMGGLVFAEDHVNAKEGAWQQAYKVRARLITGSTDADRTSATRLAFVQLELEPGWKTYWRHPGEAGGIPPEFVLQESSNLKAATVLYPAPIRMSEDLGDTIGYKKSVIFPIRLTPSKLTEPINLHVDMKFGICKDICVPSEAKFTLTVPERATQSLPAKFMSALDAVPREQNSLRPKDPILQSVNAPQKDGDVWRIVLSAKHESEAKKADLFLEAPAGLFIPVPKPKAAGPLAPLRSIYEITLSDDEYQALKDKSLQATVVDEYGASQAEFVLR